MYIVEFKHLTVNYNPEKRRASIVVWDEIIVIKDVDEADLTVYRICKEVNQRTKYIVKAEKDDAVKIRLL